MAITFRTSLGAALTHAQMDENFSSVYFSSSIHNITNSTSKELKLWFDNDTAPLTSHSIVLPAPGGSGTVTITGDVNNRLLTAVGNSTIQGEGNLTFDGNILSLAGRFEPVDAAGNLSIGSGAGTNALDANNILIGQNAGYELQNPLNLAIGNSSLRNATGEANTAVGSDSLLNLNGGDSNTALGFGTAQNVGSGGGNLYLGYQAGPTTNTPLQDNKLYINNSVDDTPLIYGDFATGQVTFHNQVSASVFSGSFVGNGAGLTGVTTEWDGTRNGFAQITGSLIVSGSTPTTVQFLNMTAISGSVFSGSFVGDGSGLTGIIANSEWDGTRNGNGEITGSFIVSGSSPTINLKGVTTIDENIRIHNPDGSSIGIGANTLLGPTATNSIAIGAGAGFDAESETVLIGVGAGQDAGVECTYIGYLAGSGNEGEQSTGIGSQALAKAVNSRNETALGYRSLFKIDGGFGNVSLGAESLFALEQGGYNTIVGTGAFRNLLIGKGNVALGYEAGSARLQEGYGNVYLGMFTGRNDVTQESNQLYIDNNQRNDALVRGDFALRTLTLNALKVIIPNLQQGPDGLPQGALYLNNEFVCVVL